MWSINHLTKHIDRSGKELNIVTSFMDELLAEVEEKEAQRKLDLDKVKADKLLMALTKLDEQSDEIGRVAGEETAIVETWRKTEQERL